MGTSRSGRPHLRLMNEYCCDMPLWDDEGHPDGDALGLSAPLREDLSAFAARWEAAVPDEVYDDRWDGVPVMRRLVSTRYALHRLRPGVRRRARAEDASLRATGESPRRRLQDELGDGYLVTYHH